MIQCEIPLKLNKYVCYESNKAYQGKKISYLSVEVAKNPWIWKNYIEIQLRQWFYYISFVESL